MVNIRQNLSLFILVGLVLFIVVSNAIKGDQSNTTPTSKYHWIYWEVDRTAAILIQFGQIVGGMAVITAVFWRDFGIIKGIGALYAIVGVLTLSQYLSNDPDFNYIVWQDIGFILFPIAMAILRLTGRIRPLSERTEAEQQAILQKREQIKQEISQELEEEARIWWLKWLPLLLVVAGIPTAIIGWMIARNIRGIDEMYPIYAGFVMVFTGIVLFKIRIRMKWYRNIL